ncbi:MAG: acetyl-/propionyl-CoA carboxylase subunit alpha, partial [Aeromicrobium sp.]|uniref:acetyl-CoA carboxylase biotin carboxyl carrier protein subunit n=1 Tax=Aeromicrobium sp. TaxID=1871063 RepID=UPI00262B6F3F
DGGYEEGETIPGSFDSLVAKLIVSGTSREQVLQRSRRALDEFVVDGMPTVIPFHRSVVDDPAFTAEDGNFTVYTTWIETDYVNELEPYVGVSEDSEPEERERVVVEVGGKRVEVVLPGGLGASAAAAGTAKKAKRKGGKGAGAAAGGDSLVAPMQGTVVKVTVAEGQEVAAGDQVIVVEAMKMEQPINAHKAGIITGLKVEVGGPIGSGEIVAEIKDAAPAE